MWKYFLFYPSPIDYQKHITYASVITPYLHDLRNLICLSKDEGMYRLHDWLEYGDKELKEESNDKSTSSAKYRWPSDSVSQVFFHLFASESFPLPNPSRLRLECLGDIVSGREVCFLPPRKILLCDVGICSCCFCWILCSPSVHLRKTGHVSRTTKEVLVRFFTSKCFW